jgi:hypothetical protein
VRLLWFKRIQLPTLYMNMMGFALQPRWSVFARALKATGGELEAFVCRTCRHVEWRARSVADVELDHPDVVEVEGDTAIAPSASPYR